MNIIRHLPLRDLLCVSSEIRGFGAVCNVRSHPTIVRAYYWGIGEHVISSADVTHSRSRILSLFTSICSVSWGGSGGVKKWKALLSWPLAQKSMIISTHVHIEHTDKHPNTQGNPNLSQHEEGIFSETFWSNRVQISFEEQVTLSLPLLFLTFLESLVSEEYSLKRISLKYFE